jgi:hypothetical protein
MPCPAPLYKSAVHAAINTIANGTCTSRSTAEAVGAIAWLAGSWTVGAVSRPVISPTCRHALQRNHHGREAVRVHLGVRGATR